jgi:NAD(P)-dependent dehydrogenase (short-subunit alcohol dehydrogenase family)
VLLAQGDEFAEQHGQPAISGRSRRRRPIRRVVEPADVAALALHLMTNTALTGATYDVDGGQQLIP